MPCFSTIQADSSCQDKETLTPDTISSLVLLSITIPLFLYPNLCHLYLFHYFSLSRSLFFPSLHFCSYALWVPWSAISSLPSCSYKPQMYLGGPNPSPDCQLALTAIRSEVAGATLQLLAMHFGNCCSVAASARRGYSSKTTYINSTLTSPCVATYEKYLDQVISCYFKSNYAH